jgi:hypothetical protein
VSRSTARHQRTRASHRRYRTPDVTDVTGVVAGPAAEIAVRARHRRPARGPAPVTYARRHKRIAVALAGSTLLVAAAAPVAVHWSRSAWPPAALDQAQALSSSPGGGAATSRGAIPGQVTAGGATSPGEAAHNQWSRIPMARVTAAKVAARMAAERRKARRAAASRAAAAQGGTAGPQPDAASASVYRNPLRAVAGLIPERVDMGVDFGGAGPVYALGNAVITNATADSAGWPGGGWITYQLTSGPAAGLMVYVAEDVTPSVQAGQTVTSSTVIANMFNGGAGIETGWAMPDGSSAESQLAVAGGISGGGPFPTMVGLNFEALLQALGVPAAPNATQAGNGILPSNYPTNWTAATKP